MKDAFLDHQTMAGDEDWEYCWIEFFIWYDPLTGGEGAVFQQNGWLRFYGKASRAGKPYVAAQSREVPIVRLPGSPCLPERRDPIHLSLHQEFVHTLIASGWELLPKERDGWWTRRFRRRAGGPGHA